MESGPRALIIAAGMMTLWGVTPSGAQSVEEFYRRVEADEELRRLFPEDLTEGREKQALFLEQWLGGEPRYSELYGHPRLRMRHFPFLIDEKGKIAGAWYKVSPADTVPEATKALG